MPIKPENKKLYPKNWKEIRARILMRANNKCEFCQVKNHDMGYRKKDGTFVSLVNQVDMNDSSYTRAELYGWKIINIVLTIAHIHDMNPSNCADDNLKALCQRCHNKHDAKFRSENRKRNKINANNMAGNTND